MSRPAQRWQEAEKLVRRMDFDGAARLLLGPGQGLGIDDLLRNNPSHDLLYSIPPRGDTVKPALLLAWRKQARRRRSAALWTLVGAAEMSAGRTRECERSFCRALALEPRLGGALLLRAAAILHRQCMERQNHLLPHCLADLEQVLEQSPQEARALRLRAELKNDFQDFEGASADLRRLIALEPRDGWAKAELADMLCDAGRFEEVWPLLDGLKSAGRGKAWYWALRGRAVALCGDASKGLRLLRRASRLDPRCGVLPAWIGECYRRRGQYRKALAAFDEAIRLDPLFVYSYEWRGRLRLMLGQPLLALGDINRFVVADARHRYGPCLRAEALFKLGRYEQAMRDFDQVPQMDPRTTWNPRVGEGELATPQRREAALWEDLSEALRRQPRNPVLWILSGRFKNAAGLRRQALEDLSRAASLSLSRRRQSQALSWRGKTILDSGADRRALRDLDESLALDPSNARARVWRAQALSRLGRNSEALREYDAALRRPKPEFSAAFEARASLHRLAGRWELACRDFARAFSLDIRSSTARESWLEARGRLSTPPSISS